MLIISLPPQTAKVVAHLLMVSTMFSHPTISSTVMKTQTWIALLGSSMATSPALTIRLLPESIIYTVGPSRTKVGLSMEILIEIHSWRFSAILMTKPARREGGGRNIAIGGVDPAGKVGPFHKSRLDLDRTHR